MLITGKLKQVQRRYSPAVEKALLTDLLTQYQALPAAQHVAEFDAVFGTTPAQLKAKLDAMYAGTRLGDEAQRLSAMQADRAALAASDDTLLKPPRPCCRPCCGWRRSPRSARGELLRLRPAYMKGADRVPPVAGPCGLSRCQLDACA